METSKIIEWANNEVAIATRDETDGVKKHYDAALTAFATFVQLSEGLDSPGVAKTILTQLLHEDPLSAIEADNEEDWVVVGGFDPAEGNDNPGFTMYQCKRRSTLYKKVTYDRKTGEVDETKYSDASRAVCFDIDTEEMYQGGIAHAVFDEMVPIQFPYSPIGRYRIFTEEFKAYKDADENDTVGVLYIRDTDGRMTEVKRFFKVDHKTKEYMEIDRNEYYSRRSKARGPKNKRKKAGKDE